MIIASARLHPFSGDGDKIFFIIDKNYPTLKAWTNCDADRR
jgi:hypothetical protein